MAQMALLGDLHIRCSNCGKKHIIPKDYLDYNIVFLEERGMGAEYEHDFTGEERCSKCGNWMSYKVMGYEYPEGAFNSMDYETSGCEFIEAPNVDIDWTFEFDYPEYAEDELYSIVSDAEINIYSIANDPQRVYELRPDEFEDLVAEVFHRKGFNVTVTPRTRDGGKDIIASYNMNGIPCMLIIECKRYAAENKVGVRIVRELHGTQQAEACGYPYAVSVDTFEALDAELAAAKDRKQLSLIEVKCSIGAREDLGRPTTTALENKQNFMEYLKTLS